MGTVDREGRAAMRHAGIGTRTGQTSQVVWWRSISEFSGYRFSVNVLKKHHGPR